MLIAIVVIVVGYHLVRLAFEAHTLVTSTTCDPVTAINTNHRDFTLIVWTLPDPVFLHILFKGFITSAPCLLACYSRVIAHLNKIMATLHSMQ